MLNLNDISADIDNLKVSQSFLTSPEMCIKYIGNSNNSLKIIHINIRSINKNLPQFEVILSSMSFQCDILILTECWLKVTGKVPTLDGYNSYASTNNLIQNDGVVVYIKSGLLCTVSEPLFLDANCLVCVTSNTAIICIYRSPSYKNIDNFINSLHSTVTSLKSYNNLALIGDINVDIKPNNNTDRMSDFYLTATATMGLLPAHYIPTRVDNCLDHVLLKSKLKATTIVLETAVTDHMPVLLCLKQKANIRQKPALTTTVLDYLAIQQEINSSEFTSVVEETNADRAADQLINSIKTIISNHTRTVKIPKKNRNLKPWITPGLLRCIRNRDNMHLRLRKTPDDLTLKITYTRYRNFCNKLLKN